MNARAAAFVCAFPALLAGCKASLKRQPRYDPYGEGALFADGKAMQAPPAGSVALEDEARAAALANPPPMSMALLERGRERYGIFCVPCHGVAGDGRGIVPARGFPTPPDFDEQRLREAPTRRIVDVITNGYGAMYSHAARVPPGDRWAIAAYIRALQLARRVAISELPAGQREVLERKVPASPSKGAP